MTIRDYMETTVLNVDFAEFVILNTFTNGNSRRIIADSETELLLRYGSLTFSSAVIEYHNDTIIITFIIKY